MLELTGMKRRYQREAAVLVALGLVVGPVPVPGRRERRPSWHGTIVPRGQDGDQLQVQRRGAH